MKILILKPSSLGDVVQALPVLRLLKLHFPQSQISWWLDRPFIPLLEGDPDLCRVIPFERKRWAKPAYWPEIWRFIRQLRAEKFDWVIDLQSLARSGSVAWLASGKLTVGLDDHREGARGFYDIVVPRASYHTHAVDWYLSVLPHLGVPVHWNFEWLPVQQTAAQALQQKWQPAAHPWIALCPGARWKTKRWPAENFARLAQLLAQQNPALRFVILGGADDQAAGREIAEQIPEKCLDLTGKTTLGEMVEWLRLAQCLLTNDTGPMHVAAALRKPVVALFGPTEPRRTGPYGQLNHVLQHPLPCAPCMKGHCAYREHLACLREITPASAAALTAQILTEKG